MRPNASQLSRSHAHMSGRGYTSNYRRLELTPDQISEQAIASLRALGIGMDAAVVRDMTQKMWAAGALVTGQDSIPSAAITTPSIPTPIQFLQAWLPGFVKVVTAARKIDELVGMSTVGSWEDEQIVQGILELTGSARPFGDYTPVPLSSWNANFEYRTIVRFEEGMKVGRLEDARAARMQVDSGGSKREAAALALDITRNQVGFYGYNSGDNKTYGFLNDPSLPAYVSAPTGNWNTSNFTQITTDLRVAIQALRTQSQDTIDPETVNLTLAVSTNRVDFLSTSSDFNVSVRDWLTKNYPKVRVVSAPQLNAANGGANVFYLYAETFDDTSTDNGRVFDQLVASKFQVIGVSQQTKSYEEDYLNALAGVLLKRPFAVVRYTGI